MKFQDDNPLPHPFGKFRGKPRWWPLVLLGLAMLIVFALGLPRYLTLANFAEHIDALHTLVHSHLILSLSAFFLLYMAAISLSVPGAAILTIAGGALFGWGIGAAVSVISATAGGIVVVQIVKASLREGLVQRAGKTLQRFQAGFSRNSFTYLLTLRLAPVVPFCLVNVMAGLCQVPLRIFALATLLGAAPGSLAYAWLGSGIETILSAPLSEYKACLARSRGPCNLDISLSSLVSPMLLAGLGLLAVIALVPLLFRSNKAFHDL